MNKLYRSNHQVMGINTSDLGHFALFLHMGRVVKSLSNLLKYHQNIKEKPNEKAINLCAIFSFVADFC